jgi:hypothetical protein
VQVSARAAVFSSMGVTPTGREGGRLLPFVCECGEPDCTAHVPLTRTEYAALPAAEQPLALAPAHAAPRGSGERRERRKLRDGDG